ncbi:hypothetical protein Tco_0458217 [Tanacetum coccineum]
MAKQAEVNKRKCKGTGQRENRPVWNNVNRVNHQNQFVPTAVLTRTGKIQVNTARASSTKNVSTTRHNFNSQAVPTNVAKKVNIVKPIMNNVRPKTVFHQTYSPIRRPFNRTTAPRTKFSNQKFNTTEVKRVSVVGGKCTIKCFKRSNNGIKSRKGTINGFIVGLGYGFTKKACFVCGSFSHLIRDYDFHEKRMAKQVELNKQKGKGTVQRENKPVWNNVQRLNHQNKFVPIAILTRTGRFPINTASQAASTSTARKVNTVRPIVNEIRPRNNFFKSHSPTRRPFYKTTAPKDNFLNHKVNTAGGKTVSVVGGIRETVVKASADYN